MDRQRARSFNVRSARRLPAVSSGPLHLRHIRQIRRRPAMERSHWIVS